MFLTKFLTLAVIGWGARLVQEDCKVQICSFPKIEMDYTGKFWPRYCKKCGENEEEAVFLREYLRSGWKYVDNEQEAYQGRVLVDLRPCGDEVDCAGNEWTKWCIGENQVKFEKVGEEVWVYRQDFKGGYKKLQFRRIINDALENLEQSGSFIQPIEGSTEERNEKGCNKKQPSDSGEAKSGYDDKGSNEKGKEREDIENQGDAHMEESLKVKNKENVEQGKVHSDKKVERNEGKDVKENSESESQHIQNGDEVEIRKDDGDHAKKLDYTNNKNEKEAIDNNAHDKESAQEQTENKEEALIKEEAVGSAIEEHIVNKEEHIDHHSNHNIKSGSSHHQHDTNCKHNHSSKEPATLSPSKVNNTDAPIPPASSIPIPPFIITEVPQVLPDESLINSTIDPLTISKVSEDLSIVVVNTTSNDSYNVIPELAPKPLQTHPIPEFVAESPSISPESNNSISLNESTIIPSESSEALNLSSITFSIKQNTFVIESSLDPISISDPENEEAQNEEAILTMLKSVKIESTGLEFVFSPSESNSTDLIMKDSDESINTPEPNSSAPADLNPDNLNKTTQFLHDENCCKLEGDRSGRYFFIDYTQDNQQISYIKDKNKNFIVIANTGSRVRADGQNGNVRERNNANYCIVYNSQGISMEFEPDLFVPGVFWERVIENGETVKYILARSPKDKQAGMYLIDQDTGYRFRSFFN